MAAKAVVANRAPRVQIGGHTRFVVGCVAEALSRSRAAGDARAVGAKLVVEGRS